ncbi:unnamed protein product [Tilletia laevis]|uniref:Uncharacterized protein n=2 Tax=Tilletia TaxID=13289 RepID=A0A8T8S9Q9_9BASI|nr:hypothetical protein CF336_g6777 [Tilletia laevis]KAE8235550.1 hypothetical protein A4X03_0g9738 [Tilletia caries]CAD6929906.1 unnamed protein product [Tilletia caries]CAD6950571.1 unnamed protein product [Tilletia laevis]CAD6962358.1 unnamed protein product [Tilletia caries]
MASFGDSEDIGTTNPVGGRMREQSLSPTENDQLVALFAKHWQISPDEAAGRSGLVQSLFLHGARSTYDPSAST